MVSDLNQTKLRDHYGPTIPVAAKKVIRVLATTDAITLDVSPKGGAPGFAKVETDRTLLIPDYPGNNRIDGMLNIAPNPQVATVFFIPGVPETLRVNGSCEIIFNPEEIARLGLPGKEAKAVMRITVQEAFIHCEAALAFAKLWQPESWPKERPIESISQIVRDHAEWG